jgi:hypothetical protein
MNDRIRESELVLPSLLIMENYGGSCTTSDLIRDLRTLLNPQGTDLLILAGRNDDRFSQKVRNLRSHSTFERYGFAHYDNRGRVHISDSGQEYLNRNRSLLTYLLSNDFSYEDVRNSLTNMISHHVNDAPEPFDELNNIQEGAPRIVERRVYERSNRLRLFAIQRFTTNGRIFCNCCNFNYDDFYGHDLSNGYIEIHHIRPIYQFNQDDTNATIARALGNLIPVCSNCHKIIHRNRRNPLDPSVIIQAIYNNGVYVRRP